MTRKNLPDVVSSDEWRVALDQLLIKEKELTRARDALSAERRKLPMVKVTKQYTLEGEHGKTALIDLFEGRRQLIVYHFMFAPDWDAGCGGCSWVIDAMTHPAHLHARDTSLVLVSSTGRGWGGLLVCHGIRLTIATSISTLVQQQIKARGTVLVFLFATAMTFIEAIIVARGVWNIWAASGLLWT